MAYGRLATLTHNEMTDKHTHVVSRHGGVMDSPTRRQQDSLLALPGRLHARRPSEASHGLESRKLVLEARIRFCKLELPLEAVGDRCAVTNAASGPRFSWRNPIRYHMSRLQRRRDGHVNGAQTQASDVRHA
jgi:hypothetical protein